MKLLFSILLLSTPLASITVLAAEVPSQFLVQAMLDKSESMTKIKHDCNSRVRDARSEEKESGVYLHTLVLGRDFRGQPGKDCKVMVTQDLRPTYYDGAVEYTVVVEETDGK